MKKSIVAFVALLACTQAFSQHPPAEQIVKRYADICAEKGYVDTIRTARFVLTSVNENDSIALTIIKEAGRKYYLSMFSRSNGQQVKIYNQGRGVSKADGKTEPITDEKELEALALQSHILPDLVYQKLGYKLTFEEQRKLDSLEYYLVKIQSPLGTVSLNFYEKESGLLRMKVDQEGTKSVFLDYFKFKGGMYPKKNLLVFEEGGILEFVLQELTVNEKVDSALFNLN